MPNTLSARKPSPAPTRSGQLPLLGQSRGQQSECEYDREKSVGRSRHTEISSVCFEDSSPSALRKGRLTDDEDDSVGEGRLLGRLGALAIETLQGREAPVDAYDGTDEVDVED